jgi:precorrin-3B methylase
MFGNHCIKTWSSTQDVVALSSGEAEYYAMVKAISQGIGVRNLLSDMGIKVSIQINTDASAAKAIASRRGCGRIRHIDVATLWVQEKVANGEVSIKKVAGTENLADILTKHVDRNILDRHLRSMGFERCIGRHSIMPKVES